MLHANHGVSLIPIEAKAKSKGPTVVVSTIPKAGSYGSCRVFFGVFGEDWLECLEVAKVGYFL